MARCFFFDFYFFPKKKTRIPFPYNVKANVHSVRQKITDLQIN